MASGVEELLDMLFEMIDEAKNAPLSSDKCVIERDRALDLIDDIRSQFPMELTEAKKMMANRAELIASTKREAEALRKAGFVDEEILMLRSTTDREELERLVDLNVVCTISSVDTGVALNALAENRSTVVEAHIQVDTGMGFGGFLVSEPEKVLLAYRSLPNVALSGIYTQLHATRPHDPETRQQLEKPLHLKPEWQEVKKTTTIQVLKNSRKS